MGSFIKIRKNEIEDSLIGLTRQYVVGNLQKAQKLQFIRNNDLEIGITEYKEFSSETPHYHDTAIEFQYMVSGWTQYMDVNTKDILEFKSGDFYAIEKNTVYAQKAKAGTRILFIKVPSINDKKVVEASEEVSKWLCNKLKTVRTDYYYDVKSPKANSIKPAAAVAIVRENKILLLKRADNKKWTMPGGTLEFGESMTECAVRELMEECGYQVKITDIIGTYTDPNIKVEYSDGEVRQEFTIVYKGEIVSGKLKLDNESTGYCWIDLNESATLPMADSQKRRLLDVINYLKTGEKSLT